MAEIHVYDGISDLDRDFGLIPPKRKRQMTRLEMQQAITRRRLIQQRQIRKGGLGDLSPQDVAALRRSRGLLVPAKEVIPNFGKQTAADVSMLRWNPDGRAIISQFMNISPFGKKQQKRNWQAEEMHRRKIGEFLP